MDKKGWERVTYPIEEIMKDLNCSKAEALKCMKELEEVGLIKVVRQGQGKSDIVYVMNIHAESE